jgi:hypothetical protein
MCISKISFVHARNPMTSQWTSPFENYGLFQDPAISDSTALDSTAHDSMYRWQNTLDSHLQGLHQPQLIGKDLRQ